MLVQLCSVVFAAVNVVMDLPVALVTEMLLNVSVQLPHQVAVRMVRDAKHDTEMATGLVIIFVVLLQFLWGLFWGVSSWIDAFFLFVVVHTTFSLNSDHYSMYMHTEGHKYWTPEGTWTFLGKRSSFFGVRVPKIPLMDYLWFLTGYPPAWGTVTHAKVHHVWHTLHPLDVDYIFDRPRNSVWAFLLFNLRAWFTNMLCLGVLRIYLWWPRVRVLSNIKVRQEWTRQMFVSLIVIGLICWINRSMLWFILFNMMMTNLELNISTWIQHSFLNYVDGTCNPWNSTTIAHDAMTWSGCAEHLKHHISPAQSQEAFIEWHKTAKARELRQKYGFHVFNITNKAAYYRFFWAIITGDYDWLVSAWVAIPSSNKHQIPREEMKTLFRLQLERVFQPAECNS